MKGEMNGPRVDAFVERAERELNDLTSEQLDEGWHRFKRDRAARAAAARGMPARPRSRRRVMLGLAGFAVASGLVLAAILEYRPSPAPPLHYVMEGLVVRRGNTIEASPDGEPRLLFSDESRVVLDASTRLTIEDLDAGSVRIGLLEGAIDVFVKPRSAGTWVFSAGPFQVHVKGTSFRLAFAQSLGRLGLKMTSGKVEVSTPKGQVVVARAGDSIELFASPPSSSGASAGAPAAPVLDESTTSALATKPEPSELPAPHSARRRPTSPVAGERSASRTRSEVVPPAEASLAWTQWLRQGNFARVVADAEQRGIDQIIAVARPADMAALADAARYIERYPLSRRVLLAMRSRFTGTEPANDAAFFLGRLAEATTGTAPALDWYETYLREAPAGLYAKAAMGREMRLRSASPSDRTRRIARHYLERFPQGPEADLASALVGAKPE